MATNIDRSLYSAPMGLDETQEPAIEVEIENPESVEIRAGGLEILLEPESETSDVPFDANLAEHLDDAVLGTIASDLVDLVEADINSRKDWVEMFVS